MLPGDIEKKKRDANLKKGSLEISKGVCLLYASARHSARVRVVE